MDDVQNSDSYVTHNIPSSQTYRYYLYNNTLAVRVPFTESFVTQLNIRNRLYSLLHSLLVPAV
jgi:hypothetical protein